MDDLIPQPPLLATLAVVLAGLAIVVAGALGERAFVEGGALRRLAAAARGAGRLAVLVGVLGLGLRLLPDAVAPSVPLVGAAVALAIGWSARDLLRDVVAGLVLWFDRSLVRGARVTGDAFEGVVVGRTARSLELEGARGRRVIVPFRELLARPVSIERDGARAVHRFTVHVAGEHAAARRRILEAVAASPAVPAGRPPELVRDPADPTRWEVAVVVVERAFARRVESEVRERLSTE